MSSKSQVKTQESNLNIVQLDSFSVRITISGELTLPNLIEIENYFKDKKEIDQNNYVILDLTTFSSIAFNAKQYVHENRFFPEKGFEIFVFGLKKDLYANMHLLFHNDTNIHVYEFENEKQAKLKAKELYNRVKMEALAIGPSSFTGIVKKNIEIKDKEFVLIHDKSWNYKTSNDTYFYKIDLLDVDIFISRPSGYIEFENSLKANVLFDKVVYKVLGADRSYYRIQDYSGVISTSLSARRDFTNYIINNINRIELMVFYGLNSFMKAIVKFGKLIHPTFYKVRIADSFEEAIALVMKHKYGEDYFSKSIERENEQISNGDILSELKALKKENEALKASHYLEKKKLLEAIGGVLWSDDSELQNILNNSDYAYNDLFNALKVLKQDLNEINQKKAESTKQLLHQTQVLTKEIKAYKEFAYQSGLRKKEYVDAFNFEIRSPFQSILSNIELLSKIDKTPEYKEIISQLNESILLINKRLKNHFEVGSHSYLMSGSSSTVFNIDKTIQLVLKANLKSASSKGVDLIYEKDAKVPSYLIGDEDKLRLIVEQFITNAVYYTSQGEIVIRTKLLADFETSAEILVEVEDSGIGMTEEEFNRCFTNDNSQDRTETYIYQNQAVGLTILSQLAEVINGEIGMKSKEPQGSIFSIRIQLNKGVFSKEMNLKQKNKIKYLSSTKLKDKSALFVIADPTLESVYMSQFNQIGIQVKMANNESHTLSLLKSGRFDMVFIESSADENRGIRLLDLVLETLDFQIEISTKIIFIMSSPDSDFRDRIMSKGCSATIYKPYQIIELKKLLESIVV